MTEIDNENVAAAIPDMTGMPNIGGLVSELSPDFPLENYNLKFSSLPVLPVRDLVPFPYMVVPITVGREKSLALLEDTIAKNGGLMVVAQKDASVEDPEPADLYKEGMLAIPLKLVQLPDGTSTAVLAMISKCSITRITRRKPFIRASVDFQEDTDFPEDGDAESMALIQSLFENFRNFLDLLPEEATSNIRYMLGQFDHALNAFNLLCLLTPMDLAERQKLLETRSVKVRMRKLLNLIDRAHQLLEIKINIHEQTHENLSAQQREQFLQSQLRTIQDELGNNQEDTEEKELKQRAEGKKWSKEAREHFDKELKKLGRYTVQAPEYAIQYSYLDNLLNLPWNKMSDDNFDLAEVERVLDRDHFGMEKVKERIMEHIAVLKLRNDMKAPILCLYGPPGVGKTSLGRSIAEALGREYARVSLGGLHDEAEIRGHRRTYIGAMPGRILSALAKCGNGNPVFVLDEIDKIGKDFKGDPSTALLEVLDPEQNSTFHDNYIDFDYDLSKILFIATANSLSGISSPLLDRMEIIEIGGYVAEEKVEIALRHLWPRVLADHGFEADEVTLTPEGARATVDLYTRESGVRQLEKKLAGVVRKIARLKASDKEYPKTVGPEEVRKYLGRQEVYPEVYESNDYAGVVTGLAWTSVGGEILFIESSLSKGKDAKLTLTGNLGDVMKESAVIALQYLKAHADRIGIEGEAFEKHDVHIHVPEGAVPKDGPSAGVTIATSLASAFTGRRVRDKIAMTGEITLRGKVLPVGGIKEKILAAKRAGISEIIMSEKNRKDVEEIPARYLDGLSFRYVDRIEEVLDYALLPEKALYQ